MFRSEGNVKRFIKASDVGRIEFEIGIKLRHGWNEFELFWTRKCAGRRDERKKQVLKVEKKNTWIW
jgi:hypothetical protein